MASTLYDSLNGLNITAHQAAIEAVAECQTQARKLGGKSRLDGAGYWEAADQSLASTPIDDFFASVGKAMK